MVDAAGEFKAIDVEGVAASSCSEGEPGIKRIPVGKRFPQRR
ncbi:MAG TPA: hypothetical protein VHB46_14470 [Burkholderiales bacterium]|nr:hypothetical protein [Burkholderiales bacterium]